MDRFDALIAPRYEPLSELVRKTAARAGVLPDELEDVRQETMLRAYRWIDGCREAVATWMRKVAHDTAQTYLRDQRREKRERVRSIPDDELERLAGAVPPAAGTGPLWRALAAGLTRNRFRILYLRHLGLSYEELGVALGIPPRMAGTRLGRARRQAADILFSDLGRVRYTMHS